jgi:transposase-like protein
MSDHFTDALALLKEAYSEAADWYGIGNSDTLRKFQRGKIARDGKWAAVGSIIRVEARESDDAEAGAVVDEVGRLLADLGRVHFKTTEAEWLQLTERHLGCCRRLRELAGRVTIPEPTAPPLPPPPPPTGMQGKKGRDKDQETRAIAALATIGDNVSQIAKSVGVSRSTLYGWPEFMRARSRMQGRHADERNERAESIRRRQNIDDDD